jgi:hypothetical protein
MTVDRAVSTAGEFRVLQLALTITHLFLPTPQIVILDKDDGFQTVIRFGLG